MADYPREVVAAYRAEVDHADTKKEFLSLMSDFHMKHCKDYMSDMQRMIDKMMYHEEEVST